MSTTDIYEKLRDLDELTLLELLEINSSELVDAFTDKIEDNLERIWKHLHGED